MKMEIEKIYRALVPMAALTLATALSLAGCGGGSNGEEEILPGRSRPLLEHDWPHPRDFQFAPSTFTPPDAAGALVNTTTGLRAYVIPDASDPLVRITAAVPLGRLYEQSGEAGASRLLTELLTRHGPADPNRPLSLRLESLGTALQMEEDLDVTQISVEVLAEDWQEGLAVLIDVLRRPDFENSVLRHYRTGAGYSTPTSRASGSGFQPKVELERILAGYPLAPADPGLSVTGQALRALAGRTLRPNRVVLGVGGNVPRAEVEAALNKLSEGWDSTEEPLRVAELTGEARVQNKLHTIDVPSLEGWIAIGRPVGPVPESERAGVAVMAHILGTRLNIAVREIRGLANHTVFVLPDTASGAGLWHVRTGGRTEAVAPLVKFCWEEIEKMHQPDDPITEDEIEQAKGALVLSSWQAALDGARQASATYAVETVRRGALDALLQWPEAVTAVTVQQVKEVAQKYLSPEEMVTVVVGPIDKIREARHPRWPVDLSALEPTPTS